MTVQPVSAKAPARQGAAARRTGYVFAIAIDAAMLGFVNVWPGWRAVPFLTEQMTAVLPLVNASILAGVAANLVYLAADPPRLRALGDVAVTTVGLVAMLALWRTFPFDFAGQTFDWALVVRVLLGVGIGGSAIAVVVGLVRLVTGR